MGREIKFRAYCFRDNKMERLECVDGRAGFYDREFAQTYIDGLYSEVMQFTGLKDSNGVEIYEGDIVQFTYWWFDGSEQESTLTGEIVYSDELMSFQLKGVKNEAWERHTGCEGDTEYLTPFSELNFDEADFSVIGNIHENPQLLQGNSDD